MPPPFLRELLVAVTARAKRFRNNLRQYNAAFAFTSLRYNPDERVDNRQGVSTFQIHGELYHLHGPLTTTAGNTL